MSESKPMQCKGKIMWNGEKIRCTVDAMDGEKYCRACLYSRIDYLERKLVRLNREVASATKELESL